MKRVRATMVLLGAATLLSAEPTMAARYTQAGLYSLELEGWHHQSTPLGELFACEACSAPVQVQITYGAKLPGGASAANNKEFLGHLDDDDKQHQFAELMLKASLPQDADLEYQIESVRKVHIGGIDALEYVAVIHTQPRISREDAMVALHKNRVMKLTLNFFDEGMDEAAAAQVGALLKSLKFF